MRTIVIILILFCWVCSFGAALRAQTMLGVYSKQNLLPAPFVEPETVRPLPAEFGVPDFRVSTALERHAALWGMPPESLLSDYYGTLTERFLPAQRQASAELPQPAVNRRVFTALYNAKNEDEKDTIRRQWEEAFGVDVWFAYYKAKEAEDWVKQRLSVRIGKFKGEPAVDRTRVFYTFKSRF